MISGITREVNTTLSILDSVMSLVSDLNLKTLSNNEMYEFKSLMNKIKTNTDNINQIVDERLIEAECLSRVNQ